MGLLHYSDGFQLNLATHYSCIRRGVSGDNRDTTVSSLSLSASSPTVLKLYIVVVRLPEFHVRLVVPIRSERFSAHSSQTNCPTVTPNR
jgi:hypothetical protein